MIRKELKNLNDYIWYASYGSNISEARFLCYIKGGQPEGATRNYKGCTDKTPPIKNQAIKIPHELYFAKKAKIWHNGGVGFIKPNVNNNTQTLGRMYLIKKTQFAEVVQQENALDIPPHIPYEKVIQNDGFLLFKNTWYGYLLFLGYEDQQPIFTFTNERFLADELNPPHEHYLNTIKNGIREIHNLTDTEINRYLKRQI